MNLNFEELGNYENPQQFIDFINSLHTMLLEIEPAKRLEYISRKIIYCKNVQKIEYILQEFQKYTIAELASVPKDHKTNVKSKTHNGRYVGIEWVMEEFGVARQTVYGWVHKRLIPYKKIGKQLLFEKQEVYDHAQCLRVETIEELKQKALDKLSKPRAK